MIQWIKTDTLQLKTILKAQKECFESLLFY